MNNNVEGKVVVITGASSGLGEAAAKHLSELGATVVLGAREPTELKSWLLHGWWLLQSASLKM